MVGGGRKLYEEANFSVLCWFCFCYCGSGDGDDVDDDGEGDGDGDDDEDHLEKDAGMNQVPETLVSSMLAFKLPRVPGLRPL